MYKGAKWKNKRKVILKRDGYKCVYCKRYGKSTPADMVHHIYPYESNKSLAYKNYNLISLCNNCHNKMHNRENHLLTREGESLKKLIWKLKNR